MNLLTIPFPTTLKGLKPTRIHKCLDLDDPKPKEWDNVTCPCGNKFHRPASKVVSGRGRYCSQACKRKYKVPKSALCTCSLCGKEFKRYKIKILPGASIFCSRKCSNVHRHLPVPGDTGGKEKTRERRKADANVQLHGSQR